MHAWLKMLRLPRYTPPPEPKVIGQIECPKCKRHWELHERDGISPNGGMLALPLHRPDGETGATVGLLCPVSEQLVRIQLYESQLLTPNS